METCKKCGNGFQPQKGLKSFCSLRCRNSRTFSPEAIKQKSQRAILSHRSGAYNFRKTCLTSDEALCSYGCGNPAKYRLGLKQTYCCEDRYNKCEAVRKKNAEGLKEAYKEGRKSPQTFTEGDRENSRISRDARLHSEPFEKWSKSRKKIKIQEEQKGGCRKCGISDWMGEPIVLELEHKDGNRANNSRDNLELLCPNCHSQTPTFRGRNVNKGFNLVGDEEKKNALLKHQGNVSAALKELNLAPGGGHWRKMVHLWEELQK